MSKIIDVEPTLKTLESFMESTERTDSNETELNFIQSVIDDLNESEEVKSVTNDDEFIKYSDLNAYPVRLDHFDKENGSLEFVLGIESVLDYARYLKEHKEYIK